MNSVYDRPLFANKKQKRRDARTKLLNMGGIIASSPELMQAAQPIQTMMSPVTQQRNMNQGGYIPGYDKGGHVHPHNTQQQISNTFQPVRETLKDTGGQIGNLATVPANYLNSLIAGGGGLGTDVLSGLVSAFGFTDAGKNLADSADRAYKTSGEQVRAGNANLLKGLGIDVSEDPSAFMANMTGSTNAETEGPNFEGGNLSDEELLAREVAVEKTQDDLGQILNITLTKNYGRSKIFFGNLN